MVFVTTIRQKQTTDFVVHAHTLPCALLRDASVLAILLLDVDDINFW